MAPAGAFEHCRRLVAEFDKERYWASLYAPADKRDALYALYAFDREIARVPAVAREPIAAEIRLQWWREVLERKRDGEAAANPVAAALLGVVARHDVPAGRLIALIDVRGGRLYDEQIDDLEAFADAVYGAIIVLAAQVLGGQGEAVDHIAHHAGAARAYAEANDPTQARGHLDAARTLLSKIPQQALPALLPAAVIGPSFGRDTSLPLWRRQWIIWRAARNPQRIFG
ncbi:MAG TPA: squalene/phytoene synthase family protein [Pseudolabrys sp.]|nr:squalene/phytoene synthase family protein [Pseudolabrys sp.]